MTLGEKIAAARKDKKLILNAIEKGNLFIGNDLIKSCKGFKFNIRSNNTLLQMGESGSLKNNMRLFVSTPYHAEIRIFKNGKMIANFLNKKKIGIGIDSKGIYRVECYKRYLGKKRGWIYSNPIYIL